MKLARLLAIALCVLTACTEEPVVQVIADAELTVVAAYMASPQAVARGEALFKGSCAEYCHNVLPIETDASFLFACEWLQETDDAAIAKTIRSGIPNTRMVGFGSNFPEGDADLWKLIAYLRLNQAPCA